MAATDLVIDANVVVKWFVDEDGSDDARGILGSDRDLLVPAHALGEIGDLLRSVPLDDLFVPALDIAWATRASVYDALYVVAASRADAQLVTSDDRLLRLLSGMPWAATAMPLAAWGGAAHP